MAIRSARTARADLWWSTDDLNTANLKRE